MKKTKIYHQLLSVLQNGMLTLGMLLSCKGYKSKKENNRSGQQEDHSSFIDSYMDYFSTLTRGWLGTQKSVMVKNLGPEMSTQRLGWESFSCLIFSTSVFSFLIR